MNHGHDVVIPFRQMRQQSVENLEWLATRGHLKCLTAERRLSPGLSHIFPAEQVKELEDYADAMHRRAMTELVVRARRSNPKRRLR